MATYTPAAYPRRSKHNSLYSEAVYQVKLAYYRYELNTGQYVMSPGEKIAYNLIVMLLIGLFFSAIYFTLPRTAVVGIHRIVYYLTGSHQRLRTEVLKGMPSVVAQNADSVASLGGVPLPGLGGISNATATVL